VIFKIRTAPKRDWLQITLNLVVAGGCIFMAYNAIRYPRTALTIVLAIAGTMAFIGLLSLAGTLIGRTFKLMARLICKMDDKRRGEPSDFSLADRIRLRLLAKPWLANWLPHLWDGLREDLRRSRCCEISDCWNEPTCTWEEHNVCSEHYAEIAKMAAADRSRLQIGK
jgi:hypothetical protein